MKSFKCNKCGRLEEASHAGTRQVPAGCRVCGAGVAFNATTGIWQPDSANWIQLWKLSDTELKAHGLTREEVAAHDPSTVDDHGHNLNRALDSKFTLNSKKDDWATNEAAYQQQYAEATDKLQALLDGPEPDAPHEFDAHMTEVQRLHNVRKDLEGKVWSERDEDHLADVEKTIKNRGAVIKKPGMKSVFSKSGRLGQRDRL